MEHGAGAELPFQRETSFDEDIISAVDKSDEPLASAEINLFYYCKGRVRYLSGSPVKSCFSRELSARFTRFSCFNRSHESLTFSSK